MLQNPYGFCLKFETVYPILFTQYIQKSRRTQCCFDIIESSVINLSTKIQIRTSISVRATLPRGPVLHKCTLLAYLRS
jgi:hypothetical protein